MVLHDIINNKFAHKAIEKGADGLIAVAAGAGGHAGVKNPFALIQEIRSGSTVRSRCRDRSLRETRCIGTAFIATEEARAPQEYKEAIVAGNSDDIVYSNLFTGVHGNYLRPSILAAGLDPDNLPVSDPSAMSFGGGEGSKKKAWKDIWGSGQGIGAIKHVATTAQLIDRLKREYADARARLGISHAAAS